MLIDICRDTDFGLQWAEDAWRPCWCTEYCNPCCWCQVCGCWTWKSPVSSAFCDCSCNQSTGCNGKFFNHGWSLDASAAGPVLVKDATRIPFALQPQLSLLSSPATSSWNHTPICRAPWCSSDNVFSPTAWNHGFPGHGHRPWPLPCVVHSHPQHQNFNGPTQPGWQHTATTHLFRVAREALYESPALTIPKLARMLAELSQQFLTGQIPRTNQTSIESCSSGVFGSHYLDRTHLPVPSQSWHLWRPPRCLRQGWGTPDTRRPARAGAGKQAPESLKTHDWQTSTFLPCTGSMTEKWKSSPMG